MKKIGQEQSFLDHLEVLRWHLIRSASSIFICAILAFLNPSILFDTIIFASKDPSFFTYKFFCWISNSLGLGEAFCIMETVFELNNFTMPGQFTTHIVSSLVAGFIISFPYIIWEIWRFVGPALSDGERKYSRGIVFYVSLLFIFGVLFGYYFVSPLSVQFLGNYQISSQVANQVSLNSFISIVTTVCLANGLIFQLPVFVYFLSKFGLITPAFLRKYRKHALVCLLLLAAIITPPDIMSQILVTFPLMILYEISITISSKFDK